MQPDLRQLGRLLGNEAFRARRSVVLVFVLVMAAALGAGLLWPKGYVVFTTILVDEKNIIGPLMEGAAVATEVADRARIARDVIFGQRITTQILKEEGWLRGNPGPEEQENLAKGIVKRTSITSASRNIIRIEYRDVDAERAFRTTRRLAELFIEEALGAKAAESQAAFEFIDKQVAEYHDKLAAAEQRLKDYRSANLDSLPGSDADIITRLGDARTLIERTTQELRELQVKRQTLERQLSGEAEVAMVLSRENQYRARIGELQAELERLRLNYHDGYPDIVRLRYQIADLNEAVAAERRQRESARAAGRITIDETVINNPMYQQLKRELFQTQSAIDTLNARLAEAKRQSQRELERGQRVHSGEATLAELTRDYQVNRDIHQDLLKRRENARVSMNLDREKQGLSFKIQEPATMPVSPSGPGFLHFIVGGLMLGVLMPVGLLLAQMRLDGRVRESRPLAEATRLPILAEVPHLWSPAQAVAAGRELQGLVLIVAATLLVTALLTGLRGAGLI